MQFGVCGDTDLAAVAARAGYDYAEWSVPALLKPRDPDDVFRTKFEEVRRAALPYPVANCFVPADLKITGPDVDRAGLDAYVATTMDRAQRAGIEIVVFGSGGARRIPDGFDRARAHDQLVAFCRSVAPVAHDHGVTVAVEPLNVLECNVLNTVDECATLVNEVAHPGIRLLVDAYHMMRDGDDCADIIKHADLLVHAHIATAPERHAPGGEPCDFSPFFEALARAGYTGRLSIEARLSEPEAELPQALALMRQLADATGDG